MTKTMESVMTGLPLPAPFLEGLRTALERIGDSTLAPGLDLFTTPAAIIAKVALPGVKREDVEITVGEDLVTISGSVKEDDQGNASYVHQELSHGSFSRSFWLPVAVRAEAVTASLAEGLLTLTLPKTDRVSRLSVKVEVA